MGGLHLIFDKNRIHLSTEKLQPGMVEDISSYSSEQLVIGEASRRIACPICFSHFKFLPSLNIPVGFKGEGNSLRSCNIDLTVRLFASKMEMK